MNLKCTGILAALAVSAAMAQNAAPAETAVSAAPTAAPAQEASAEAAPAVQAAPQDKFTAVEQELAPENLFAEPSAVRGADAAKPVAQKTTTKKFVYQPVYSPADVETSGAVVKTIYVTEAPTADSTDMDKLRGLVPLNFTFGVQGFIGGAFLMGDNGRYEYDDYSGLAWSAGAFALFPLDEYNMAIKAGVMFEHDKVLNTYNYVYNQAYGEYRVTFSQYRISLPILLSLKSARSSIFFDVGVQPSFATADKFKLKASDKSVNIKEDMMDNDCRSAIDWSIVFGLGIRANRYVGFDARFTWGINNQYEDYNGWAVNNLSSKSFTVGATFYAF